MIIVLSFVMGLLSCIRYQHSKEEKGEDHSLCHSLFASSVGPLFFLFRFFSFSLLLLVLIKLRNK